MTGSDNALGVDASPELSVVHHPDAALRAYAMRQLEDLETHVQAIIARLLVYVPVLNDVNEDLRSEMTNWLRELSAAVMNVLASGDDFEVLGPMLENVGRRRKSLGIEQAQTMASSRFGQQALHDHVRDFFHGHPQESEMMEQVVPRLLEFQHVMTLSVARGYASGPPLDDAADRQGRLQLLLDTLLGRHGWPSQAQLTERAAELGIQLPLTTVTVSARAGAITSGEIRSVTRMNHWAIVGMADDRLVALTVRRPNAFPAPSGVATLPDGARAGEIAAAIARAATAADVAAHLHVSELNAVDAAPFAAMLAMSESDREAFLRSCFGTLPGTARGISLLTAVSAALTSPRLADAALTLHVHRHTLDYRLKRFTDQTGLDLSDPLTRLRVMSGLFLLRMLPLPGTMPSVPATTGTNESAG